MMVEFFAPWCPACVTFLPHLETLKDSNADLPLKVVKVFDADDDHGGGDNKSNWSWQGHTCWFDNANNVDDIDA